MKKFFCKKIYLINENLSILFLQKTNSLTQQFPRSAITYQWQGFFFRRNTMQRQTENISYFEIKINCHCYWSYSNMYLWTWHYQIKILSGLLYKKMKYKCLVQNNINISFKKMKSGSRQFLFLQFKIDL